MNGYQRTAFRVSAFNTIINAVLAILKLTAGFLSHSEAMISDGVHSIADAMSTVVVMIGIRLSSRRSDAQHPYGHERMECVAAVVLAVIIGVTGIGIGVSAVEAVFANEVSATVPGAFALWMPLIAIAVKECMFRYTRRAAVTTGSAALMADAWHQRTDALSSVGGFIGVLGARLGFPVLDPIAGVLISLLIIKAALDIFCDAMRKMTDRACDEETAAALLECIQTAEAVLTVEDLKTRLFGNRILVETTVGVEGGILAKEAFVIASGVREKVMRQFPRVKDCAVHIRPL